MGKLPLPDHKKHAHLQPIMRFQMQSFPPNLHICFALRQVCPAHYLSIHMIACFNLPHIVLLFWHCTPFLKRTTWLLHPIGDKAPPTAHAHEINRSSSSLCWCLSIISSSSVGLTIHEEVMDAAWFVPYGRTLLVPLANPLSSNPGGQ